MEGMSRRDREAEASIVREMFRDLHEGYERSEELDDLRDATLHRMCSAAWPTAGAQRN